MLLAAWDASLRRQREHRFLTALLQGMRSTKPTCELSLFPKAAVMFAAATFFTHSPSPSSAWAQLPLLPNPDKSFYELFFKAHDGKMQCSGDFGFLSLWAEHHLPSLVPRWPAYVMARPPVRVPKLALRVAKLISGGALSRQSGLGATLDPLYVSSCTHG